MRSLVLWAVSAAAWRVIPPSHLSVTPAKAKGALPLLMRGGGAATVDPDLPAAATQEVPPLAQHPRRKVSLLVEPTPFTHVSGYSNRFKEMLRFLKEGGDDIEVITPDDSADRPAAFLDIPITYVPGFRLFLYRQVQLTVDFGLEGYHRLKQFGPDLIHVAAPGFFVMPAVVYARLLGVPLVISYHTHLPVYAERYVPIPGLQQLSVAFAEWILPTVLNWGDLTLATSPQLQQQLTALGCSNVDVWRKGIDTEVFHPKYNASNLEMRQMLTDGHPASPLLLYVGRIGAEKSIKLIREVLRHIPEARLAIVGKGPAEAELKQYFAGTNTKFLGLMQGESLSRAYASADVFVMPSESETLGFVVLEAMASGVVPVCAAAGGLINLVRDGATGCLFRPGDAADMTAKVRRLLEDAPLRREMGQAGRDETLRWDWKAATSVLRNMQYSKAEANFKERVASPPLTRIMNRLRRQADEAADAVFGSGLQFNASLP
jgi:sulfoquinovosyltransferase